ncbi:unnamed protein product [Mytilus edulis]|uniref:IRG-type G domain-containing protein n=1 Tax=Mytilus edulis TaxID=6550 RepID=A0A8S3PYY1_MYTED|nr:unnamed protein product [Mytilus edulis]
MNSSEVIRCQYCNSNIYQCQRYCDKCGRSNSEDDLTSSTSLYREEKVNQEEKWEPTNKAYDAELNDIYAKLKKEGKMETSTYIGKKLAEAKTMNLKFAVIGRSAVGKSSFINMMLDLQPDNTYYGETGARDTTKNAYAYKHPQNENITFFDMPGFGTMEMTIEKFLSMFGSDLNTFDYFFIFIDTVIMERDVWLVEK